jgi:type VI secretion system protein ImpA
MPLPPNLLEPIPGNAPSGENLYYSPLYDKIREARREEEEIPQGEWRREVKRADFALVVKLATEALTGKTKDLQLAAWLTEAWLRQQGPAGLADGLDLLRGLLENFWDTLYPELEDGDAEMRATPLEWLGSRLGDAVRHVPLTRNGLDWFRYKESRSVPSEDEAASSEAKSAVREQALADGKMPPEEFDAAFSATTTESAAALVAAFDRVLESLTSLGQVCDEKFGEVSPGFGPLRASVEEVRQSVRILLAGRGAPLTAPEPAPSYEEVAPAARYEAAPTGREPVAAAAAAVFAEPADQDDAFRRIAALARYIRKESQYSPISYLLLRGLRWGELRVDGPSLDESKLEAPPTEIRQKLKRLSQEGQWEEVLETAETAMAMSCGRGWLDLQRFVVRACEELGSWYDPIAQAVRGEVKTLLQDYPQLRSLTMSDDTPTANPETQAWLDTLIQTQQSAVPEPNAALVEGPGASLEGKAEAPSDAYDMAMEAMRGKRTQEAFEIMSQEIARVRSGRLRFKRKVQLAQLCMASGHEAVAFPILEEIGKEIERRNLEEWESPDMLAHPLVLLLRCLNKLDSSPEERQKVYARICRLDPIQALGVTK